MIVFLYSAVMVVVYGVAAASAIFAVSYVLALIVSGSLWVAGFKWFRKDPEATYRQIRYSRDPSDYTLIRRGHGRADDWKNVAGAVYSSSNDSFSPTGARLLIHTDGGYDLFSEAPELADAIVGCHIFEAVRGQGYPPLDGATVIVGKDEIPCQCTRRRNGPFGRSAYELTPA